METILDIYKRPYDAEYPVVCMDELNKQLVSETRQPLPARPGKAARYDFEYKREGVANAFICFEPLGNRRTITIRAQRTHREWSALMQDLVDVQYATAKRITVVLDNLNTHTGASLYKVFAPAEARRILDRLELQYTPKHGSWLNMAEIELSNFCRQCLNRRIPDSTIFQRVATGGPTAAMTAPQLSVGSSPPPTRTSNSNIFTRSSNADSPLGSIAPESDPR